MLWDDIERDFPQTAPRNLGNMGYFGKTSLFLPASVQQAAYSAEGLILEFYRGFNVSWTDPSKYFEAPSILDTALLKRCNETRMMTSQAMELYANLTGDWDGVELLIRDGRREVRGRCFNDYFWYPPACRENSSRCVLFVTAGNGWNLEETMQKSTAWNMPLAPVVAKNWSVYTYLPLQVRSTFYWWVPDPTFISLKPMEITFPPFDRQAHIRGDKRTAPSALTVDKYVSQDLSQLAPSAEEMVRAMLIDLQMVNDMLLDQVQTGDSYREVACRWIQSNQEVWRSWLPDPTTCFAQFGLYHEKSGQYVADRGDPTDLSCKACLSGTYSHKLVDLQGLTFNCLPCPTGSAQPSGASLNCEQCQRGEYQDEPGSKACKRCGIGEYQDEEGQTGCKPCPPGTTTLGFGSKSAQECGCDVGSINSMEEEEAVMCVPCMEGLHCPFGSNLPDLRRGHSTLGEAYVPQLKKGFFATLEHPINVFKCGTESHCPGGQPNSCAEGRQVTPCSECPRGTSWVDETCAQCAAVTMVLWVLVVILFFVGLTMAYYLMNPEIRSIATPREAMGMSLSLTVAFLQCVAIMGLMTVKWPNSFQAVSLTSKPFMLDIEDFSFACLADGPTSVRYVSTILVFPAGILYLVWCYFASSRIPCCYNWSKKKMQNTVGHFIQVGFSTMSALALDPLMCYTHPNGQQSLLQHPGVLCGTQEHSMMMLAGFVLLFCGVFSFLAVCTLAVIKLPGWSVSSGTTVQSFAFLFTRFRPNRWWYGVPLLLRGPLLSFCVVAFTDFPPAQTTGGIVIILGFLLLQVMACPWKLPLLNVLDTWVFAHLLLLQSLTTSAASEEDQDLHFFQEARGGVRRSPWVYQHIHNQGNYVHAFNFHQSFQRQRLIIVSS
ncbi:unnamed protein product [Durusdinium trenchii]|uniref:Tyrosine-protein kinase ephrin type A/B receptor-like domain-containing protein n=1 Tax=Durusdinium trenchii TaxID=1381693 RepID=A0ABP0S116_9DINO